MKNGKLIEAYEDVLAALKNLVERDLIKNKRGDHYDECLAVIGNVKAIKERIAQGKKIKRVEDLFDELGIIDYTVKTEQTFLSAMNKLKKAIYKGTDCGAWINVIRDGVELGSIVEGSDAEVGPVLLPWGFTVKKFWDTLQDINDEARALWHEANDWGDD